MRKILIFVAVLLVICGGFYALKSSGKQSSGKRTATRKAGPTATLGKNSFSLEIVNTPEARYKGLSGRESLEVGSGMLFAFEKPDIYCFVMRGMKFNLDILWIREDGTVTTVVADAAPASYPDKFCPQEKGKYVLEVNAGAAKANGVVPGFVVAISK